MKKRKKKEFSKKIFDIVITLFMIIILYSMALMWKTNTTDGLTYLIPVSGGLATTAVGFYFNKAKMENSIKLSKKNDISLNTIQELENKMNDFDERNE